MKSESLSQRLAQLSAADKQRLLAHLLREKARNQPADAGSVDPLAFVRDAQLDPNIQPLGQASQCNDPRTVLLTGATGFLGAHLLHELFGHTRATIYCLVRAQNADEARQRLQTNFARYFTDALDLGRVRPLVGDLAERNLGLTSETY